MLPLLEPLPYQHRDMSPWISPEAVALHYEHHHRHEAEKLAILLRNTPAAALPLDQLFTISKGPQFEAAAQVWAHNFFWKSLRPNPRSGFETTVAEHFGSLRTLRDRMVGAAEHHFGCGYLWLYREPGGGGDGRLILEALRDADNPLLHGGHPILCIDLWEHAYYLDYRSRRADYVANLFDHLIDWRFAADNWRKSEGWG